MIAAVIRRTGNFIALAVLFPAFGVLWAQTVWGAPIHNSAFEIPTNQLIQAEELNRELHNSAPDRPLVLQVGSRVLFDQAHIAGSEYAGPGSQDEGLKNLQSRVNSLPRNRFIVLYCGCCPWNRCPNVEPAFKLLLGMGFTHVKVLYIAENFGTDWVQKGYPVERGH